MTAQFNKALTTMSLQELTEHTAGYNPGHNIHTQGMVEFTRRQPAASHPPSRARIARRIPARVHRGDHGRARIRC